jgi:hypothetical protein
MRQMVPLVEILVEDSKFRTDWLKTRLIREGIFEHRCSKCQLTEWLDVLIPLELDHKNGVKTDHRLENLCLLCPNCHALTPTYRGKNVKHPPPKVYLCSDCDTQISYWGKRCYSCAWIERHKNTSEKK